MQTNNETKPCARCGVKPREKRTQRSSWCLECRREYQREYQKERRAKDPEKYRQQMREWHNKNPDYNRQKCAERVAANPEKFCAYRRNSYAKRKQDSAWSAMRSLRGNISKLIQRGQFTKRETTSSIIGYDIKLLGAWAKANGYNPPHNHIDHKEPVAYYLRLYPRDVARAIKEAWSLDNLQILSARDNIRKGDMRYGEWLKTRK